MILRRLSAAFFLLSGAVGASSSPSIDGLLESVAKLSLSQPAEAESIAEKQNTMEYLMARVNEIAERPEFVNSAEIVEKFEQELKLLTKGLTKDNGGLDEAPNHKDVAMLITHIPGDFKEFVLNAKSVGASTILKHLPLVNCWEYPRDYHRILVYVFANYYDEDIWKLVEIDWEDILWAAIEVDNAALAAKIQGEKAQLGCDMKKFNLKLLSLCLGYDAVESFKLVKLNPIYLKKYIRTLAVNSSAKLLKLYQHHTKDEHLHLKNCPPPVMPPANVEGFKFLMENGQDQFPMTLHITNACKWGRLDIFQHLHTKKSTVNQKYLRLAAKRGRWNILEWAFKSYPITPSLKKELANILAIHRHFQALGFLIDASPDMFTLQEAHHSLVQSIIKVGDLRALQWIVEKLKITSGKQEWINSAIKERHSLVFEWLYKRFKISPNAKDLSVATVDVLTFIQAKNPNLIDRALVKLGVNNFELLRWILKNRPELLNDTEKRYLSRDEHRYWLTEWLIVNKDSLDAKELVAYVKGNLNLLQNVFDNKPSLVDTAAEWEILSERKHEAWLEKWTKTEDFGLINEELVRILTRSFEILQWSAVHRPELLIDAEKRLSKQEHSGLVIRWICEGLKGRQCYVDEACLRDDLVAFKWVKCRWENFPTKSDADCALNHKSFKILEWLYQNHPVLLDISKVFQLAIQGGGLVLAEQILQKYPVEKDVLFTIGEGVGCENQRLKIVQWLSKHNLLELRYELNSSARRRHFRIYEWLVQNHSGVAPLTMWSLAARYGCKNAYRMLLGKHSDGRARCWLIDDFREAIKNGHLGIVKLIIKKDPLLAKEPFKFESESSLVRDYLVKELGWSRA